MSVDDADVDREPGDDAEAGDLPSLEWDALDEADLYARDRADPIGLRDVLSRIDGLGSDAVGRAFRDGLRAMFYRLALTPDGGTTRTDLESAVESGTLENEYGSINQWLSPSGGAALAVFESLPGVTSAARGYRLERVDPADADGADHPDPVRPGDDGFRAPLKNERSALLRELKEEGYDIPSDGTHPLHAAVVDAYDHLVTAGEATIGELAAEVFRPCDQSDPSNHLYGEGDRAAWVRDVLRPSLESGVLPGLESPVSAVGPGATYRYTGCSVAEMGLTRRSETTLDRLDQRIDGSSRVKAARVDAVRSAFDRVREAGDRGVTASALADDVDAVAVGYPVGRERAFVVDHVDEILRTFDEVRRTESGGERRYTVRYDAVDKNRRIA